MNLHENNALFSDILAAAGRPEKEGGIGILLPFIEKDYWITRSLQLMSRADSLDKTVFKGGTSLTKGYGLGNRFSEDIDIAVAESWTLSGNQLKMFIKRMSKAMTEGLIEIAKPSTSKGSRYHKAYYSYATTGNHTNFINTGEVLVEINSFANPYPYQKRRITSFVYDFLMANDAADIIEEYDLHPFEVNVLDKKRTITEKLVSLFRASLGNAPLDNLRAKIRHFYDLHFLWNDMESEAYLKSEEFLSEFNSLLDHDRKQFSEPSGWADESIEDSPLLCNTIETWNALAPIYEKELASLAYSQIPPAAEILHSMQAILNLLK